MICQIKRKGSWVGCLGWQRGRVRTFFLFNPFPLFQIKVEPLNSYFSIIQRKKGTFRNQWQSLINTGTAMLSNALLLTAVGETVLILAQCLETSWTKVKVIDIFILKIYCIGFSSFHDSFSLGQLSTKV